MTRIRRRRPHLIERSVLLGAVLSLLMATSAQAVSSGTRLWESVYQDQLESQGSAIAVSPDGASVFATGTTLRPHGLQFVTIAYDAATGAIRWTQNYVGPARYSDPSAIDVSPDSSTVFVTGFSYGATSGQDYVTIAYDASTGRRLWLDRFNGRANGDDVPTGLSVNPNGSAVYVSGWSDSRRVTTSANWTTLALDPSTGAKLWQRRQFIGVPHALAVSPDGSKIFIGGQGAAASGKCCVTIAADDAATGKTLWRVRRGPLSFHRVLDIGVASSGRTLFVAGPTYVGSYGAILGKRRWLDTLPTCRCGSFSDPRALQVSPDGRSVFVAGVSYGGSAPPDFSTAAFGAATGTRRWVATYDGASHFDFTSDVGVSPDGVTVYVTGWSEDSASDYNYATVAYTASTGTQQWVSRYAPPPANRNDTPLDLVVNPTGPAVYVTGTIGLSHELGCCGSIGTVAYEA
jgi:hypothetical protein